MHSTKVPDSNSTGQSVQAHIKQQGEEAQANTAKASQKAKQPELEYE